MFKVFQNLLEFFLSVRVVLNNRLENALIEIFLFEEDSTAQTKDVLIISYESILKGLTLAKRGQVVVIYYCFFENYHELVDTVNKLTHFLRSKLRVMVVGTYKIYEFLFDEVEHAFRIVKMSFKGHRKFKENL